MGNKCHQWSRTLARVTLEVSEHVDTPYFQKQGIFYFGKHLCVQAKFGQHLVL